MTVARRKKQIEAPHEQVWPLIEDFANVHKINPFVKSSKANSEYGICSVGDTRRCDFYNGKSFIEEQVIAIDEGRSITVKMIDGTMPFKQATANIHAIPVSRTQSKLTMTLDYQAKGNALTAPIAGFIMKPMMLFMLGRMIKAVELHLKTGQPIGKNSRLASA